MRRRMMKSKIHRAVVTDANVSAFFDVALSDVCVVVVPIQQNFVADAPVNGASGKAKRPPLPTSTGIIPRGG